MTDPMLPTGPDPRPVSLEDTPQPPESAAAPAAVADDPASGSDSKARTAESSRSDAGLRSLIVLVVAVIALAVVYFVIR